MLDEASLHLASCSHGARISVEISHCNLAAIRQNEQNGAHGWRSVKRLLLIRESSLAKSLVVPPLFFTLGTARSPRKTNDKARGVHPRGEKTKQGCYRCTCRP